MTIEMAVELLRSMIGTTLMIVVPLLGAALSVGISVSLLQSLTSIQEQTLSFVPKLLAIGSVLVVASPWMIRHMMEFTIGLFEMLPEMVL